MFRYNNFKKEHFLEFLNQGLFDEEINEILKLFQIYEPDVQYQVIKYIKEKNLKNVSLKTLASALGTTQSIAREILQNPYKEFFFPLVSKEKTKLGKALVIKNTSKLFTNISEIKASLRIVKQAVQQNFAVFFDEEFTGKSFMLPLALAITVENLPEKVIFTGKIDKNGNVFEVEGTADKLKLVSSFGYKLILPSQVKNIKEIKEFLDKKFWDIPVYITSEDKTEAQIFLNALNFSSDYLKNLSLFYDFDQEFFTISTKRLEDSFMWEKVCREFYEKYQKIRTTLKGEKHFHFAFRSPASLSMALGVIFGSQDPFSIYHYQAGKYTEIKINNPREIKERVKTLHKTKYKLEKNGNELVIILKFGHHELVGDVKNYVESFIKDPSYLIIEHIKSGNVPIEEFKEVVCETASIIQNLREERAYNKFHFFFSCPVPIAFMIGVAFGHYAEGTIYNFQKEENKYIPAIDFLTLRKIREGGRV